jgi:hypothetical protein
MGLPATSKSIGNTNQWLAYQTGNGSFAIPLTARYVQTAPNTTPLETPSQRIAVHHLRSLPR